jgi:septum formation topological specificity factor MinE
MGFFSNLFKSKKEKEIETIFNRINLILNSDEEQNKLLPEALKKIATQVLQIQYLELLVILVIQ